MCFKAFCPCFTGSIVEDEGHSGFRPGEANWKPAKSVDLAANRWEVPSASPVGKDNIGKTDDYLPTSETQSRTPAYSANPVGKDNNGKTDYFLPTSETQSPTPTSSANPVGKDKKIKLIAATASDDEGDSFSLSTNIERERKVDDFTEETEKKVKEQII